MREPKWLDKSEVIRIHTRAIDTDGGSHGMRDETLLESALARPQNLHAYGEDSLYQLAASYAEGIARNHAFVDGNKRTAFMSSDMFLYKNGIALEKRTDDGYVSMMENLGQGKISREDAAKYLKENSQKLEKNKERSEQQSPTRTASERAKERKQGQNKTRGR